MAQGSRHALLIGNTEYQDWPTLRAPAVDVCGMKQVLQDPDIGNFSEPSVLLNQTSVKEDLEEFLSRPRSTDAILIYFSGHGERDDYGDLFLIGPETRRNRLESTAIAWSSVQRMLDKCLAGAKVVVLDCCHSGTATESALRKGSVEALWQQGQQGLGEGTVVLTATSSYQEAKESMSEDGREGSMSVFTRYLVEGLQTGGAAKAGSPDISVGDWYEYAQSQVQQTGITQTPMCKVEGGHGRIVIAKNAKYSKAGFPEELTAIIRGPRLADQLEAVDRLGELATGQDRMLRELAVMQLQKLSLCEHTEVRAKARARLNSLGFTAPTVPLGTIARSWLRNLIRDTEHELLGEPWWPATLTAMLIATGILSLPMSLFTAFFVGTLVTTLAVVPGVHFAFVTIRYSLGSRSGAQLVKATLLACFGVACLLGFIVFQSHHVSVIIESLASVQVSRRLPEQSPESQGIGAVEEQPPKGNAVGDTAYEKFFALEDRDDAFRVCLVLFGVFGGLVGVFASTEARMIGMWLGAALGSAFGLIMGAALSVALNFGEALREVFDNLLP